MGQAGGVISPAHSGGDRSLVRLGGGGKPLLQKGSPRVDRKCGHLLGRHTMHLLFGPGPAFILHPVAGAVHAS